MLFRPSKTNDPLAFLASILLLLLLLVGRGTSRYLPNILFVVLDDVGMGDLGYHGISGIPTPTMDAMALGGVRLSNYYVPTNCVKTRTSIHTGRYPERMGWYPKTPDMWTTKGVGTPADEQFLPQVLKDAGYQRHAVGKWHMGNYRDELTPTFRGYQTFLGSYANKDHFTHSLKFKDTLPPLPDYYDIHWDEQENCDRDCTKVPDKRGNYSAYVYADAAIDRINDHDGNDGPLFLYVAFNTVHTPMQAPKDAVVKFENKRLSRKWGYQKKVYAAMLKTTDDAIKRIAKALVQKELYDDTLIIVTTDNGALIKSCATNKFKTVCGPTGSNLPYKGTKLNIWEGGIRGEGFISGKALPKLGITPGTTFDGLMHSNDWLPTLAEVAGVTPDGKPLDGLSQLQAFQTGAGTRTELFLGYESGPNLDVPDLRCALRRKNWKIVRERNNKGYSLYNLKKNPKETKDRSKVKVKLFKQLKRKLQNWVNDVGSYVQTEVCPEFDPVICGDNCTTVWDATFIRPWCD